jgi:hypothetical protein
MFRTANQAEIVATFVETVDNEAFVLAEIADVMGRFIQLF